MDVNESSDFIDEMLLVSSMFEGEVMRHYFGNEPLASHSPSISVVTQEDREWFVMLPFRFVLRLTIPLRSYPSKFRPTCSIIDGPNAVLNSDLERCLAKRVLEEVELGTPMISMIIIIAREEAERIEQEVLQERASKRTAEIEALEALRHAQQLRFESGIDILAGDPITDRKSTFLAHVAMVQSIEDVDNVVKELRSHRSIASAAHPAIYAYRFLDRSKPTPTGGFVLSQDAEDDGETGASKKILFLMESLEVIGYVIVVTRWFGGILLGPDRFKHIMECSKQALQKHHIISE